MTDDSTRIQSCISNFKMSMITRRRSREQKKLESQRMRPAAWPLDSSRFQTVTQEIPQCESTSFAPRSDFIASSASSRLSSNYPVKNTYSLARGSGDNSAGSGAAENCLRSGRKVRLQSSSLFVFLVLLLYCAVSEAQIGSQSYFNGLTGSSSQRFKNFMGTNDANNIGLYLTVNVSENVEVGHDMARFRAEDKTRPGKILQLRINRQSDPKRQFAIDQTGVVRVAQPLDREEFPYYRLSVEAVDTDGNMGTHMMEVTVHDVNDNAPVPYTVPNPCIFMENVDPQTLTPCEIRAFDPDTLENGPPFKMDLAPSFRYRDLLRVPFNSGGDNGNGSMSVIPLVMFNRENVTIGKILEIPLILTDNKGLSAESSVFIVIGDENDSPMTDGSMTVNVNSYLGKLEKTVIGRVYVEDEDDWDLPDKTFIWGSGGATNGFSLAPNGEITMNANMPPGQYVLVSSVSDNKRREHATGTVNVNVNVVQQAAFNNQGALRIRLDPTGNTGLRTPDAFIRADAQGGSPMTRFVNKMIGYLGPDVSIQVFSVKPDQAVLQTTYLDVVDVRFAAHGTSYRNPVVLNGLIQQHRAELEQTIGAAIVSAGIDMCKFTLCDKGCQTTNAADETGVVVSANQTVIVGVNAWSNDTCTCPVFVPPASCQADLCRNGGVCHNTYPQGFFCECRNDAFKGFRCQGTTRSFDGQGYAWFKPMPACTSLNITIQFMTRQREGLILYDGPMGDNSAFGHVDYRDYIIIRLVEGRVQAEMLFNGIAPNPVQIASSSELGDGKWHTLALTQIGKSVELVLDDCAPEDGDTISENSSCRRTVTTLDDDERLNIIAPLQVGGLAPLSGTEKYLSALTSRTVSFNGCLRNLIVNNEEYDLGAPDFADETHSQSGCVLNEGICGVNGIDGGYCRHGECIADAVSNVAKCICDPGYSGNQCDQQIEWIEFGANSFISYDVAVLLETKKTDVDVLVYPGTKNYGSGALGYGSEGSKYVGTYLDTYSPSGSFNLDAQGLTNTSHINVKIDGLQMANNYSYWMQFSRNPVRASLTVDGVYRNFAQLDPAKTPFVTTLQQLLLGAENTNGVRGFQGCVGTFRWERRNYPLLQSAATSGATPRPTTGEEIISIKQSKGVSSGCSMRKTCATMGYSYCTGGFICVDFWKGPFCTCPASKHPILGPDGQLVMCDVTMAISKLGITNNAIIIIMVFLGLLLLMVLLMIIYARRQTPPFAHVNPVDLNRDNIRPYDIEGGGEADNDQYDINGLRKPVMPLEGNGLGGYAPPVYPPQRSAPDDKINNQIKNLEADPDATAPYDELRIFEDEGDDVSRLSLESLDSADEGAHTGNIDQEEIGKWGPRFENLADIYGRRDT